MGIRKLSRSVQRIETYKQMKVLATIMKQFKALGEIWLIIAMLFRVEIVSLCLWPQKSVEIEILVVST